MRNSSIAIATRTRKWAQAATLWLASRNVSPNAISIAGMCGCIIAGIALAATSIASYRILRIIAALSAHRSIRLHSGEHRPLACSIRPLGRMPCNATRDMAQAVRGKLPRTKGQRPVLPRERKSLTFARKRACFPYVANGVLTVPRSDRVSAQARAGRGRLSRRHFLRISIQARDRRDESRRSRPTHSTECGTESATAMN